MYFALSVPFMLMLKLPYSGKLLREKNFRELVKNTIFTEKLSRIARFCSTKGATPPNFVEKTSANSHKTVKFAKVFPSKVSCCTVYVCAQIFKYRNSIHVIRCNST